MVVTVYLIKAMLSKKELEMQMTEPLWPLSGTHTNIWGDFNVICRV